MAANQLSIIGIGKAGTTTMAAEAKTSFPKAIGIGIAAENFVETSIAITRESIMAI